MTTSRKVMQCGALVVSAGLLLVLHHAHSPYSQVASVFRDGDYQ